MAMSIYTSPIFAHYRVLGKYLNKILGFSRTGFDDQAQELGRIHVCVNASQRGKIARGSPEYFVTPSYLDEGIGLLALGTVS